MKSSFNRSDCVIVEEIWQQDLSKDMQIGASTEGYDRVGLRCGAEKMTVELRTTEDFSGVIYTQGNFYSREPSCFLDPVRGRSFTMSIPLNKCDTERVSKRALNMPSFKYIIHLINKKIFF